MGTSFQSVGGAGHPGGGQVWRCATCDNAGHDPRRTVRRIDSRALRSSPRPRAVRAVRSRPRGPSAAGARRILEVAAGTGRVTRHLLAALPDDGELVATDLNEPMIETGRVRLCDPRLSWQVADAQALGFPDASFDAVACQFGLMFVPDKPLALGEMRRVLRPGGMLLLSTWDDVARNPATKILHELALATDPTDPPMFMKVPFSMHDPAAVRALVDEAGFREVRVATVAATAEASSATESRDRLCPRQSALGPAGRARHRGRRVPGQGRRRGDRGVRGGAVLLAALGPCRDGRCLSRASAHQRCRRAASATGGPSGRAGGARSIEARRSSLAVVEVLQDPGRRAAPGRRSQPHRSSHQSSCRRHGGRRAADDRRHRRHRDRARVRGADAGFEAIDVEALHTAIVGGDQVGTAGAEEPPSSWSDSAGCHRRSARGRPGRRRY